MSNYITLQEIREQAGFQFKERGETASPATGDGVNKVFYVVKTPIVDRTYSGTPVTIADVVLYITASPVAVSAVDAATGKITTTLAPPSGTPITTDYDWSSVDENVLQNYADEAHSLVLTAVAEVYSLPLPSTPNVLKLIEKRLAAGLILDKEYSVGGDETEDSRGRRWIKWAEQKLADIKSGALTLIDSSGTPLSQLTAEIRGYPDATTKDKSEADSGGDIIFRIKKEF